MNLKLKADELRQHIAFLLKQHPELEEDDILRADMIEGETNFQPFIEFLTDKANDARFQIEAVDAYRKEIEARADRLDRRNGALREFILQLMLEAGCEKLATPMGTLSVRDGQPKVIITDEAAIPDDFVRIKRETDKTKIKDALKNGNRVEGAELSNAGPVLSIRIK